MQHSWGRWVGASPNWPCFESRSALSLAHPMLGQDAPQMPDGNALALFNDFGYDIPEMSSNISRYLVTIAQRAPGVSCTPVGTGGRAALVRG